MLRVPTECSPSLLLTSLQPADNAMTRAELYTRPDAEVTLNSARLSHLRASFHQPFSAPQTPPPPQTLSRSPATTPNGPNNLEDAIIVSAGYILHSLLSLKQLLGRYIGIKGSVSQGWIAPKERVYEERMGKIGLSCKAT